MGSSNGTFVNNKRVQKAVLSPGDALQLGGVSFVVQIDGVPDEEEIVHGASPTQHTSSTSSAESTNGQSTSGEFDPLSALGDSNSESELTPMTESQIHRDLMSELGDSSAPRAS